MEDIKKKKKKGKSSSVSKSAKKKSTKKGAKKGTKKATKKTTSKNSTKRTSSVKRNVSGNASAKKTNKSSSSKNVSSNVAKNNYVKKSKNAKSINVDSDILLDEILSKSKSKKRISKTANFEKVESTIEVLDVPVVENVISDEASFNKKIVSSKDVKSIIVSEAEKNSLHKKDVSVESSAVSESDNLSDKTLKLIEDTADTEIINEVNDSTQVIEEKVEVIETTDIEILDVPDVYETFKSDRNSDDLYETLYDTYDELQQSKKKELSVSEKVEKIKESRRKRKKVNSILYAILLFILILLIIAFILYFVFYVDNESITENIPIFDSISHNVEYNDPDPALYQDCLNSEYDESLDTLLVDSIDEINSYISSKYNASISYLDLNTNYSYSYDSDRLYYAASTIKALDGLYIYTKAVAGEYDLNDTIVYEAKYKRAYSAGMSKHKIGESVSLRNLVKYAITVSDNAAHEMLVDYIGRNKLKSFGRSLGASYTLYGTDNFGYITANDGIVYAKALNEFINANPVLGGELKSFLVAAAQNGLNFDEENILAGHKYGEYENFYHDYGIVYDTYPYVIAIMTSEGNNSNRVEIIKDINSKVYQLHNTYHEVRQSYCFEKIYG